MTELERLRARIVVLERGLREALDLGDELTKGTPNAMRFRWIRIVVLP